MASLADIASSIANLFKSQPTSSVTPKLSYDQALKQLQSKGWTVSEAQAATPSQSPMVSPSPSPSIAPLFNNYPIDEQRLRQNISNTWGAETPLLNDLQLFMEAGQKLPKKANPLLPIVLALRETQGGKDNRKPNSITGQNNYFNIRGTQGGQTRFINYPDLKTSIFGGQNGPDMSQGLVGQINGPIYSDFQQSGSMQDFFKRWSPPTDNNGALTEQDQNYQWILNQLMK